jgi:hypothetical protein
MTRQAEPLTIEVEGEKGLWAPTGLTVAKAEQRPVEPAAYIRWFEDRWVETHAGWLARMLRLSRSPTRISTAVRLVVRLELRANKLFRR